MDTFIPVFLTLVIFSLIGIAYLACTAPLGWEDDQGFHFGVRSHSVHNGRYTND